MRSIDDPLHNVFIGAVHGIAFVALDGRLLRVNPAFRDIMRRRGDELRRTTLRDLTHEEDRDIDAEQVLRLLSGDLPGYQVAKRLLRRDGESFWVDLSMSLVRGPDGEPDYFIAQIQDISERMQSEEQLRHQAFHDALTGLPNRSLFVDRLEHALGRARRERSTVAVLFLDLDNFKVVNDSLGHRAGDQLLLEMADRLRQCIRPGDTVARLGGDEFTVLLEGITGVADAIRVAQRIIEQSLSLVSIGDQPISVSSSIGIALSSSEPRLADDLIRDADTAMYEAKRRGKSRYEVFDPHMNAYARDRLELEIALRRASEQGEFELYYQPIVKLTSGRITEVEALVRWNSPERGLVPPGGFMPVAEESGIVIQIGEWVLKTACHQLRRWHDRYPEDPLLSMSVNLSPRQFMQPSLVDMVRAALEDAGIDPRTLKLEISEQVMMEDARQAASTLQELRTLGVRLTLDDFGTGFASLSYLNRFPAHVLKIDRSFIAGIGRNAGSTSLVDATVAIAKTLGIGVIAEGIETTGQLDYLIQIDCEGGQGYYFAMPMRVDQLDKILRDQRTAHALLPIARGNSGASARA
ncbi:MAG TPA: EAL domain-containing protein [Thermomicrobiales bacterium]|nr:EAL domain-containing protein [Thermomicrobiales bacterium]